MTTPNQLFGERLAKLRKEKGYSQQDLADMIKTSKTTVTNWETGRFKPTWDKLDMIAAILETHISALLDGKELESLKYEEATQRQSPFIQYLYSIGYSFEYAFEEESTSVIPENKKRTPSLLKGGTRIFFTEEKFKQFEKAVSDAVEYQLWQQSKQNKKPPTFGKQ